MEVKCLKRNRCIRIACAVDMKDREETLVCMSVYVCEYECVCVCVCVCVCAYVLRILENIMNECIHM